MIIISEKTSSAPLTLWEIDYPVKNGIPIVGVDVKRILQDLIPTGLKGKIAKFGWEWFDEFFNSL